MEFLRGNQRGFVLGKMLSQTGVALPAKHHYIVLDGLRGVASLMVVFFHLCEANNGGSRFKQVINHGYLAVDFFFLLSGFVIAYAYDDRWQTMSQGQFYKRRLIRLHPMVILGSLIGAALFYFGKGPDFPPIAQTSIPRLLLVMLIGCTLVPVTKALDIRGWGEMHPLNGPAWSLFFEYVGNILYASGVRKLSHRALGVLVFLAALFMAHYAIFGAQGDLIGGWSITPTQLHIGFARLLFPFFAGILLMRLGRRIHMRGTFLPCSLLLMMVLSFPRLGGPTHLWENGLYEALCVLLLFPLIVAMGAGESLAEGRSLRVARFFGDLSYPLYITHYPLVYLYTTWVVQSHASRTSAVLVGAATSVAAITIAYASLKLYDEPVRRWLSRKLLA
jgi:peptidoglycan/LPS O-acetylase OafA/YrhL